MSDGNLEFQAMNEVSNEERIKEWAEVAQAAKVLYIGQFQKKVDENGNVPKDEILASITVLSQTVASLIQMASSEEKVREMLVEGFKQGIQYWLNNDNKEV
ncbi:hypothetical protein [uncultured Prevotella sp.]|uniref:hypothetical protein n=1 Tax=uncultured Prevotella sp. TaxID=159272 RepID=UPI002589C437|nr:hypothetical protein [uncultured Prevotella sp.]